MTIIIWLFLAIIKLLGYPLLGIRFGLDRVNKINYIFAIMNFVGIPVWLYFGNLTSIGLAYFVLTICLIYLAIQVFLIKSDLATKFLKV